MSPTERLRLKISEGVVAAGRVQPLTPSRQSASTQNRRAGAENRKLPVREIVRRLFKEAEQGRGALDLGQFTNFVRKRLRVNCPVSHIEALFDGTFFACLRFNIYPSILFIS